jgi:uncharacterized membrane protein
MQTDSSNPGPGAGQVRCSASILSGPEELLAAWREPAVQQLVMGHFATLVSGDAAQMRWRIEVPAAGAVEVDSREVEFVDGQRVRHASRTTSGPEARTWTTLSLHPAPADFGTEATMVVDYELPGGMLAESAMKLLGSAPDALADKALRRFKALIEAGEVPTLQRNPSARDDRN